MSDEPTFDQLFAACKRTAVHLEMRDEYTTDDPVYIEWCAGAQFDPADVPNPNNYAGVFISSLPLHGKLTNSGNPVAAGDFISVLVFVWAIAHPSGHATKHPATTQPAHHTSPGATPTATTGTRH